MQLIPRLYLARTNPGEWCRASLYAFTASSDRFPFAENIHFWLIKTSNHQQWYFCISVYGWRKRSYDCLFWDTYLTLRQVYSITGRPLGLSWVLIWNNQLLFHNLQKDWKESRDHFECQHPFYHLELENITLVESYSITTLKSMRGVLTIIGTDLNDFVLQLAETYWWSHRVILLPWMKMSKVSKIHSNHFYC